MLIVTHPDNVDKIRDVIGKFQNAESDFVHHIKPVLNLGIRIQTDPYMEKERPTGRWLIEGNRFFTWWDGEGEPPDWALHFGFVKPEMEPVFYEVSEPTVFSPEWGRKFDK